MKTQCSSVTYRLLCLSRQVSTALKNTRGIVVNDSFRGKPDVYYHEMNFHRWPPHSTDHWPHAGSHLSLPRHQQKTDDQEAARLLILVVVLLRLRCQFHLTTFATGEHHAQCAEAPHRH